MPEPMGDRHDIPCKTLWLHMFQHITKRKPLECGPTTLCWHPSP